MRKFALFCPECLDVTYLDELEDKKDWYGTSSISSRSLVKSILNGDIDLSKINPNDFSYITKDNISMVFEVIHHKCGFNSAMDWSRTNAVPFLIEIDEDNKIVYFDDFGYFETMRDIQNTINRNLDKWIFKDYEIKFKRLI